MDNFKLFLDRVHSIKLLLNNEQPSSFSPLEDIHLLYRYV